MIFDLPRAAPNPPDAAYYHARFADLARGDNKSISGEHMTTMIGHPAAEATMNDSVIGADYLADVVAARSRVYVVESGGRPGHAESEEAKHLRDSFRLLKP